MQATEAYIESGQHPEVRSREKDPREMQDVLSLLTVVLQKQLSNAADAEDAVQDALLSAYKLRPIQRAGANVDMVNRHSRRHWRVPCPTLD
jgi:DNA-directed RNA polymerase specialized sigma24 family protein